MGPETPAPAPVSRDWNSGGLAFNAVQGPDDAFPDAFIQLFSKNIFRCA